MSVGAGRWARAIAALVLVFIVLGTGCADEGKAEEDLPETAIGNVLGHTDVIVNADRFPNFAHTCWDGSGFPIGFWSTTDRVTIIVYNDWACPGSTKEQSMTVLSGNPRDIVNAGS